MWEFIHKKDTKSGYKPLEKKEVYKVKQDVNGELTWFKARWVMKGYF